VRSDWHYENGYMQLQAINAIYEMSQYVFGRVHDKTDDAWLYMELGAELNGLQYVKLETEFVLR